jgi:hypothetical protein
MTTDSKSRARKLGAVALAIQGTVARSGRWRREMLRLHQMSEAQMAETFTTLLSEHGYRIINMNRASASVGAPRREVVRGVDPTAGDGLR